MNIANVNLTMACLSNGGPVIVKDVRPAHPYVNNIPDLNQVIGLKVTVVFPANGYESQTVTVADPTDRISALLGKSTPVYVKFDDFTAKIYSIRTPQGTRVGISAKASAVKVVDNIFELED